MVSSTILHGVIGLLYVFHFGSCLSIPDSNGIEPGVSPSQKSVHPPFTNKEKEAIKEFRQMVAGDLYQSYMKWDQYLIRWIRDSKFDLQAAKNKLLKSLQWRKDNKIDDVLQEDFSQFQKTCPYTIKGHDKEGRPIATIGIGTCDLRKLAISGDIEKFERFMAYVLESCAYTVRQLIISGKDVRDGVGIFDASGFNLRQHGCLKCVPSFLKVFQYYEAHYPDYLNKIFLINVPRIFLPIFDLALPILSDKTKSIYKMYGYDRKEWETEIRKVIDPDQLPAQFGGLTRKQ